MYQTKDISSHGKISIVAAGPSNSINCKSSSPNSVSDNEICRSRKFFEESQEEDLDVELDIDLLVNECSRLTPNGSSAVTVRSISSSPCHRSPSRNLILTIGGMLSSRKGDCLNNSKPNSLNVQMSEENQVLINSNFSSVQNHTLLDVQSNSIDPHSNSIVQDSTPFPFITTSIIPALHSTSSSYSSNLTSTPQSSASSEATVTSSTNSHQSVNDPKTYLSDTIIRSNATAIVPQDTLLLPNSGSIHHHDYHHSHRPIRIASCISVQSVASIASTDSSLSDYPSNTPICKFCHQRARVNDPLISPCHCKGTIRYMHCRCLMKWLDKLKKRNSRNQPLACEICNYEYRWRKKFKPASEWRLPPCIGNDRQWHTVFVICAILMVASMVNLIIFGEEDGHGSRHHNHNSYSSIRFSATNNDGKVTSRINNSRSDPSTAPDKIHHIPHNRSAFTSSNIVKTNESQTVNYGGSLFFLNSLSNNQANISSLINFNNVTNLLKNLSETIPALRNMLPSTGKSSKNNTDSVNNHQKNRVKVNNKAMPNSGVVSAPVDTIEAFLNQRYGIKLLPSSHRADNGASDHFIYHPHRPIRTNRKNLATKPSEVILVISGCLFFITFFLGTFAQIKSEVSFYTMIVRFIYWNQQWIIEEYDPQLEGGGTTNTNEHPSTESNETRSSSIMKTENTRNTYRGQSGVLSESSNPATTSLLATSGSCGQNASTHVTATGTHSHVIEL